MKIVQQKLQDFGYVCVENLYTNKELHHIGVLDDHQTEAIYLTWRSVNTDCWF